MFKFTLLSIFSFPIFVFSQGSVDSFYGLCMRHGGTISHCREYAQSEHCKTIGGRWIRGKCHHSKGLGNLEKFENNDDVNTVAENIKPENSSLSQQKQTPSFSQCESAYKKTQVTCNGQTIAPAVTALLNSVAQMKSSGNMKAACESAKKVSA